MHFPNGWDEEDWAGYDFIILRSIQRWLSVGLKMPVGRELTESGKRKQFEIEYGKTIVGIINEYWDNWITVRKIRNEDFKAQVESYYNENSISKQYQPSTYRINKAIEIYSKKHGFEYFSDVKIKENGIQFKCRIWEQIGEPPF
jgi:hypothetical protein